MAISLFKTHHGHIIHAGVTLYLYFVTSFHAMIIMKELLAYQTVIVQDYIIDGYTQAGSYR